MHSIHNTLQNKKTKMIIFNSVREFPYVFHSPMRTVAITSCKAQNCKDPSSQKQKRDFLHSVALTSKNDENVEHWNMLNQKLKELQKSHSLLKWNATIQLPS